LFQILELIVADAVVELLHLILLLQQASFDNSMELQKVEHDDVEQILKLFVI
jgi:hypothetical protein